MVEEEAQVDQGRSGVLYDLETPREWSESPEAPFICLNGCGAIARKPDQMQRLRTLKVLQENPLIAILKGERAQKAYDRICQRPISDPWNPMFARLHGLGRYVRCTSRLWKSVHKRVLKEDRSLPGFEG